MIRPAVVFIRPIAAVLLGGLLLAGCTTPPAAHDPEPVMSAPPPPPPPRATPPVASVNPNVAEGREFDQVRVFFATDRKAEDDGFSFGR